MNINTLIQKLDNIRRCKVFEYLVIMVIVTSAIVIGVKSHNLSSWLIQSLEVLDIAIMVFFVFEIAIRMIVEERFINFFKSGWNVFDFIIVTGSLIPIDDSEMVMLARLLRIFRVLRLVSFIPELRMLVDALLKAIPRMGYIVALMFIVFYMYAAFGNMLFQNINEELWGNVSISMLTLFRIITFEDWTDIMYETMAIYPLSWIYYLTFIFLAAFVFLNMMIGVVIDVFMKENDDCQLTPKVDTESNQISIDQLNEINEKLNRIEVSLQKNK
ncbi:ion transporter [Candidatus Thioglobus autotrophicus]|uniref:ion transporter n=1 Tax=Candidatus Thioglobus autotrophicus TaxID=1705394 RepID=UPI00299DDD51|nr:ion transporter [Candidatus Thioglobus autotrophicus]WPE17233.1 ion transporter [Candidatus Thioglobus autotrophicus]